jgi:AAA+ superfamily predicted ATPase
MNALDFNSDWLDVNQRYLCGEFARIKARLSGSVFNDSENVLVDMPHGANSALDALTESFGLSSFERDLLLLCACIEMDASIADLCAAVQGNGQRRHASFGLALSALEDPHWSALTPARPLRRWRLLEINEESGLTASRLRIDERVLHFLAGINYLDMRLQALLSVHTPAPLMAPAHVAVAASIDQELEGRAPPCLVIQLIGDDTDGQEDIAAQVANSLGLQLHVLRAEDIPTGRHEQEALATLWEREAVLLPSALLITVSGDGTSASAMRLAERLHTLLFTASEEPLRLRCRSRCFSVCKPVAVEQKQLWETALGASAVKLNGALDGVSSQFSLSARSIQTTGAEVKASLACSGNLDVVLWQACRTLGRSRLDDLAQRIEPMATWNDLILPEAQKSTLKQIAAHVRHRLKVYQEWGFARKGARGLGISALFTGDSGTGKTMAAEVLAQELHLDLYRIDLSSVVSKYIGETEKNLKRVFDAAEESGAILLFDEADALFGKRSEVKDSHDRYANIEVSYLLQRMEAYRGLAILTTNIKTALDTAFQRRLRFVVQFPFPDQAQREAIWRGIYPADVPLQGIDYGKLARLHVAGGNIRNIALNAAFLAAEAAKPVTMQHLLSAARTEAAKRERALSEAETRGWV